MHVFGQFTYVRICGNVCQASLPSFLLLAIICLDQCQMVAVELQFYKYAQHLALKSVYDKRQYIMGAKLFYSKAVFELARF